MKLKILKPNHFCLFKDKEVGIAASDYAANRFRETNDDTYLNDNKGQSFGWIDHHGVPYRDNKYHMTRPTEEQIKEHLFKYPDLLEQALERKLVEYETVVA